jgi:NAD-dependent SIR2 family protein deacetylase
MGELENVSDPALRLLRLFDPLTPGAVHRALAAAAVQGARLLTVNVDHLQERALRDLGEQPWTVDLQNEDMLESLDGVPVVKLHGTTALSRGAPGEQPAKRSGRRYSGDSTCGGSGR